HQNIRAHLVVRKDNTIVDFHGIRGKDIAYPMKSKEHCRLFLERHCADCGQCEPKSFFNEVTRPYSNETAVDQVCAGTVAAAVVETVALDTYQASKPGCCARLRVVKASERFPVGVIAYQKGRVNDVVLNKFKEGMIAANKNDRTRE